MQFIVLAAGMSKRFREKSNLLHKSLYKFNNQDSFLSRILSQINEYQFSKTIVVTGYQRNLIENEVKKTNNKKIKTIYNAKYKIDQNIYSFYLALKKCNKNETVIVIEADMFINDLAFRNIYQTSKKNKNIWFTTGKFKNFQVGGILDGNKGRVKKVKIVNKFKKKLSNYEKLSGAMTIRSNDIKDILRYIKNELKFSLKNYYLKPIIETLNKRKNFYIDLGDKIASFNTKYELKKIISRLNKKKINKIKFIDLNKILPIENYNSKAIKPLEKKIRNDKFWTKPIIIEKNYNLILDGHHRFQVAKNLNFKKIPAVLVDYKNIEVWSLRDKIKLNKQKIIKNATSNIIYPRKTVKHYFGNLNLKCKFKINEKKFKI